MVSLLPRVSVCERVELSTARSHFSRAKLSNVRHSNRLEICRDVYRGLNGYLFIYIFWEEVDWAFCQHLFIDGGEKLIHVDQGGSKRHMSMQILTEK